MPKHYTRYVQEPDSDYVRLLDSHTGGIIYCANIEHLNDEFWIEEHIGLDCPRLNVTKVKVRNR